MIILCGKSCSGKDTIAKELMKHGYSRVVTYTTRPPRKGEKDGKSYHFITEEDFRRKQEDGFFAETNEYHTEFGTWYYGSAISDYENDSDKKIIILTPSGVRQIKESLSIKPHIFYIFSNIETVKQRITKRGDSPDEAKRRIAQDLADFKGFELEADKIIYNNSYNTVEEVVGKILLFTGEVNT